MDLILSHLRTLAYKVHAMAVTLDDVKAAVTAESTVIQSAVTLLTELKAKLDEAIASGNMAKVKEIADAVGKNTQDLATAVQANTPPPSPPTPPTPTP